MTIEPTVDGMLGIPFSRRTAVAATGLGILAWRGRSAHVVAQDSAFDPAAFSVNLELVFEGLTAPVQLADPNDGSGRMFVVEQGGLIRIWRNGEIEPTPFLDVSAAISIGYEQGLLGLALSPDFAGSGIFYINYTDLDGNTHVERRGVSAESPDEADSGSAESILFQEQPFPNHNGGQITFGPDGMLYVGLGDGGSGGDPLGNAQNLGTWLGKILRLDVSQPGENAPYVVPPDNPLAGQADALPEIWSYGLRNPWRFSFDRLTGDLFIADVGQDEWEEVNLQPAGQGGFNFGWSAREGSHCFLTSPCDNPNFVDPIFEYSHLEGGCTIIGGFVYRGTAIPALTGVYLAADLCSGLLWGVGKDASGAWVASEPVSTGLSPTSFAEDAAGELYYLSGGGTVHRIVG